MGLVDTSTMYKIDNKNLPWSTGKDIQYPVINHNGKFLLKPCRFLGTTFSAEIWCNVTVLLNGYHHCKCGIFISSAFVPQSYLLSVDAEVQVVKT